jgi:hypothetical protein
LINGKKMRSRAVVFINLLIINNIIIKLNSFLIKYLFSILNI